MGPLCEPFDHFGQAEANFGVEGVSERKISARVFAESIKTPSCVSFPSAFLLLIMRTVGSGTIFRAYRTSRLSSLTPTAWCLWPEDACVEHSYSLRDFMGNAWWQMPNAATPLQLLRIELHTRKQDDIFVGILELQLNELAGSLLFPESRSLMLAFSHSSAECAVRKNRFTAAWLKETRLE